MPWHFLQDKKKSVFWCFIGVYAATNPKKKNLFEKKKVKMHILPGTDCEKKNAISSYAWQIKPVNPVLERVILNFSHSSHIITCNNAR